MKCHLNNFGCANSLSELIFYGGIILAKLKKITMHHFRKDIVKVGRIKVKVEIYLLEIGMTTTNKDQRRHEQPPDEPNRG